MRRLLRQSRLKLARKELSYIEESCTVRVMMDARNEAATDK